MHVKICGNTNLDDAQMAVELGADAVGFVFAPGVRQLTPEQVAAITRHLPAQAERVGVCPAWSAEQIVAAAFTSGLTGVQLHGGFDVERARRVQELAEGRLTVVQVLSWEIDGGPEQEEHLRRNLARAAAEPAIDRLLVDSKVGKERGGTGVSFDWERAHALLAELAGGAEGMPLGKPLLIAGGLRPETVAGAVLTLHPWGVDVSSGVESRPGKKDSDKIKEFLSSARSARLASA